MNRAARIGVITLGALAAGILPAAGATGNVGQTRACAASSAHAALAAAYGSTMTVSVCVAIAAGGETAQAVVQNSGVEYGITTDGGVELCQVNNEPPTYPDPCLRAGEPGYWEVLVAHGGGTWTYGQAGIAQQMIYPGDALGLLWSAGGGSLPSPWSICRATPAPPTAPPPPPPPAAHTPAAVSTTAATASSSPAMTTSSAAPPLASSPATSAAVTTAVLGTVTGRPTGPSPGSPPVLTTLLFSLVSGALLGVFIAQTVVRRRRHR